MSKKRYWALVLDNEIQVVHISRSIARKNQNEGEKVVEVNVTFKSMKKEVKHNTMKEVKAPAKGKKSPKPKHK